MACDKEDHDIAKTSGKHRYGTESPHHIQAEAHRSRETSELEADHKSHAIAPLPKTPKDAAITGEGKEGASDVVTSTVGSEDNQHSLPARTLCSFRDHKYLHMQITVRGEWRQRVTSKGFA